LTLTYNEKISPITWEEDFFALRTLISQIGWLVYFSSGQLVIWFHDAAVFEPGPTAEDPKELSGEIFSDRISDFG
jgi:hypothetical protein